ncbi:MAG: DNA polymerase III subunit delta' [Nitratireductor sp.]
MKGGDTGIDAWDRMDGIPDPQENLDLIGHEGVLEELARQFAGGRMHHAWLINGPLGIGKATLACRFAGHVFRQKDPASAVPHYVKPEASDPVERRVAGGGHPNLLHMRRGLRDDGKSWRTQLTVDVIRRTVSFFGTSAGENNWRVAIVDPADDLNRNAANALLKILEEPPARTLFLVLAHSPKGLLPTIRSRCQKLVMRPLDEQQVINALASLGLSEGASADELQLIARLSGGSVRRAIVLLREDGAKLYQRLAALIGQRSPDWSAIHTIASELAPANRNDRYRLFLSLAHDLIARRIRGEPEPGGMVFAGGSGISDLARWVEVWEKTRHSVELADSYNLDRKQVILNLFGALHEAA